MDIFKLIKGWFVGKKVEKVNVDSYPYKLFYDGNQIGKFQDFIFSCSDNSNTLTLERGLMNVDSFQKSGNMELKSVYFNIKGPINSANFRVDEVALGQMAGRKFAVSYMKGLADLVSNQHIEETL